ncbi:MAG: c-type cytochrome [Flavobacteriaceae bacterium]|nr:c-type cytochrome [Flavobacteriaceae bacterium]
MLFTFVACGEKTEKKEEKKIKLEKKEPEAEVKKDTDTELIALGKKLFKDKTCTTCHLVDSKVIGPSIKDINKIYAEQNADIVAFLKDELEPIVDTNPGQVAIMKANLDGFVKDLNDKELQAIKAYMLSVN